MSRAALAARSVALVLVAVAASMLVAVGTATPARSETSSPDRVEQAALIVSSLNGVIGPGSHPTAARRELDLDLRVLVENTGQAELDQLRVVVEVHPGVSDPGELDRVLAGTLVSSPLAVQGQDVRDGGRLAAGDLGGVAVSLLPAEVGWPAVTSVHPVRISVLRGARILDEAVTAVVWVAQLSTDPLPTTLVWPLDDAPWRTVDGAYPIEVDRTTRPGGRLDDLLRALESRPDAPVVLAPAVHLIEDLRDRADGFVTLERQPDGSLERHVLPPEDREARTSNDLLQRIRAVSASLPFAPVVGAYADADLVALTGSEPILRDLAGEAAADARRRAPTLLDRRVDSAAHLVGARLDPAAVEVLPGDLLLLPPDVVEAAGEYGTLRPVRSATGRLLTGLVGDPVLTTALAARSSAGPVLDVQQVVAHTALRALENPSDPQRALLILPPPTFDPGPDLATGLITELPDLPWLELVDPATLATRAQGSGTTVSFAEAPDRPERAPEVLAALATALRDLEAYAAAQPADLPADLPPDDRRPVGVLRDQLLRSTSERFTGMVGGEAEALVRDVTRDLDERFGDVEVVGGAQVTLTADSGEVPVTVQRSRGEPLAIEVEVASPGRLAWPDGRRSEAFVLEAGSSRTLSFATQARSTGTVPVTVRVLAGGRELDRTTISVRSTSVSGPALTLTAGLVGALLLAGSVRGRRRRRHRPRLEVV